MFYFTYNHGLTYLVFRSAYWLHYALSSLTVATHEEAYSSHTVVMMYCRTRLGVGGTAYSRCYKRACPCASICRSTLISRSPSDVDRIIIRSDARGRRS